MGAVALQHREQHEQRHEEQQPGGRAGRDERDHVSDREQQQVDEVREPQRRRELSASRRRAGSSSGTTTTPCRTRAARRRRARRPASRQPRRRARRRRRRPAPGPSAWTAEPIEHREALASVAIAQTPDRRRRQACPRSRRPVPAAPAPGTGTRRAPASSGVTEPGPISKSIDDAIACAATHASKHAETHARRRRHDEPRADADHVAARRAPCRSADAGASARRAALRLRESSTARTSSTAAVTSQRLRRQRPLAAGDAASGPSRLARLERVDEDVIDVPCRRRACRS